MEILIITIDDLSIILEEIQEVFVFHCENEGKVFKTLRIS